MHAKIFTATLIAASLFGLPAIAQSGKAPPPQKSVSQTEDSASATGLWRGSKLVGLNVYNNEKKKIGDINELMLDKQGKVEMVVIGVGGFLGMGEHDVAVNFGDLKWAYEPVRSASSASGTANTTGAAPNTNNADRTYPDHAILDANKQQLKSMPEFKYSK